MESYTEQTVAPREASSHRLARVLAWILIAALIFCAAICAVNLLGAKTGDDGGQTVAVSWPALAGLIIFAALAGLIWRLKDYSHVEYDYTLGSGALRVSRILNNRRRRQLLNLELGKLTACGAARGPAYERALAEPSLRRHAWYLHSDAALSFFCYAEADGRHMALLELNPELIAQIRGDRNLPTGAWHDAEGK